jgi:hypothetical protein
MNRGRHAEDEGKLDTESPFLRFYHSIKKANAKAEVAAVELARAKATKDMTSIGAFTFLDRRFREHWGQTQQINVTETKHVTVTHVEVCLPPGTQPALEGVVREVPMIAQPTPVHAPETDTIANSEGQSDT